MQPTDYDYENNWLIERMGIDIRGAFDLLSSAKQSHLNNHADRVLDGK